MLLADRTITKSGRSAGLTLDLPLGIVGTFDVAIRLEVSSNVHLRLTEVDWIGHLGDRAGARPTSARSRQSRQNCFPEPTVSVLLWISGCQADMYSLTDSDSDRTLRQISVLLRFGASIIAQLVGRPCEQTAVEEIVRNLILLSSAARTASLHETEVGQLLYSAIGAAMQLLSAENFLSIISKLLQSDVATVCHFCLLASILADLPGHQGGT